VAATQLTNPFNKLVVKEIKAFRQEMETVLAKGSSSNDINSFWLRKSHKPVLAVLLVQTDPNEPPKLYRGTNMEVSMPTGSLCAERNVIGTALAENPSLKREHLKMIAVLAVRQPEPQPQTNTNILHKSGSTVSVIDNASDHQRPPRIPFVAPTSSGNGSTADSGSEEDWILHDAASTSSLMAPRSAVPPNSPPMYVDATPPTTAANAPDPTVVPTPFLLEPSASMSPGGPSRRINLYDGLSATSSRLKPIMGAGTRKHKRTVVVHSTEVSNRIRMNMNAWMQVSLPLVNRGFVSHVISFFDSILPPLFLVQDLNPLRPCGACNEWLKKIAESNPYFTILTFTHIFLLGIPHQRLPEIPSKRVQSTLEPDGNGVYGTPCQE
jgi:cytidine deaminase